VAAEDLTHLDPEVRDRLAVGAGDLGARRGRRLRGDLQRALGAVDVHDPVPREELLELGEDTVGDRLSVLPARTSFAWSGDARPSAPTSSPASISFLVKACMNAALASRIFFGQFMYWV